MRRLIGFILLLCLFGALPSTGFAQKPKVLVMAAANQTWANEVRTKLEATGLFSQVDVFNMGSQVASASLLEGYKAVLAFTDGGAMAGNGDALGNYVDAGGGVVVSVFAVASVPIAGKINTTNYQVLVPLGQTQGTQLTLGNVALPNHPIMQGVSSFNGGTSSYRSTSTTLAPTAYTIASWSNGSPLILGREDVGPKKARRADLNFYPPSTDSRSDFWVASSDGAKIMGNALLWVAGGGAPPTRMALSPEVINFGSSYPGVPATDRCATIQGLGPATLKINSIGISGHPDFTIVSGPVANDSLIMGQTANVCIRFNPATIGSRSAILTIQTNGLDSGVQMVELRGIGAAPGVEMSEAGLMRKTYVRLRDSARVCVPISSIGTGEVRIDSIRVRGRDADAYYISSAPAGVPQGEARNICIGFRPNFEGRTDAQIKVYTNAFNKREITIPMFGVGILGRFQMTPSALDFDSVNMGSKVCKVVSFTNPGTDTVRILDNYIASSDPDYTFTRISNADSVIRPGDSILFNICFEPKKNGTRVARYLFHTDIPLTFDSPVPLDTGSFELDIIGVGVPFGRLAMKNEVFAPTAIGDEICMTDTLRNGGLAPVTINSATITGENGGEFTISGITFPLILAPGQGRAVTLCLTATAQGARTADLTFTTTSEGMNGEATFELNGVGLLNCAETTPESVLDGRITMVGMRDTAIVTVTNCGEVPHTYTASLTQSGTVYTMLGATTSPEVLPGTTTTFSVIYTPTAIGASAGTLNVAGGPDPMSVILMGTGGGVMLGATGNAGVVMKDECRTFDIIITNNGNVDWTPGTGVIGGTNAGDFTIESGPTPSTIAPGGTAVVTVKFCASLVGNESATLNFPDGNPVAMNAVFPYTLNGQGIVSSVSTVSEMKGYRLGQVYPNPVSSTASVRINLPYSSTVTLNLVSATGQSYEMVTGRYPMGESTLEFTTSNLPSGTYFYVLSNDEVRISRQLTIVK